MSHEINNYKKAGGTKAAGTSFCLRQKETAPLLSSLSFLHCKNCIESMFHVEKSISYIEIFGEILI